MFSELVDIVAATIGRTAKQAEIIRYANATLRECQSQAYFKRDLTEDSLSPDASPYIWTFPSTFRVIQAAYYPNSDIYVDEKPPGRTQIGVDQYYYGSTTYITFKGVADEDTISLAYYSYVNRLAYYAVGARPAVYDEPTQAWTYLDTNTGLYVSTLGTTDLDEAARLLVTNWMLDNWNHTIVEGTLTKIMLSLDDARGPKHYTLFMKFKEDILKGEVHTGLNQ